MYLLIDDERNIGADIIARNADSAKLILGNCKGRVSQVGFDHDLGCEESGLDVLRWAIRFELLPNKIQLVTSNPVGRMNMAAELKAAGYVCSDMYSTNWSK